MQVVGSLIINYSKLNRVKTSFIRSFLFIDDATIVSLSIEKAQKLVSRPSPASQAFGFTINIKQKLSKAKTYSQAGVNQQFQIFLLPSMKKTSNMWIRFHIWVARWKPVQHLRTR